MVMIVPFMLTVTWLSATESDYSFRQDNYRLEIAFILTALISFGWLMSMVVGIVFGSSDVSFDRLEPRRLAQFKPAVASDRTGCIT